MQTIMQCHYVVALQVIGKSVYMYILTKDGFFSIRYTTIQMMIFVKIDRIIWENIKTPYAKRKFKKRKVTSQKSYKNFDNTTIANRLGNGIDRPKLVRNRCVFEVFGGDLCCNVRFWISVWVWGLL